MHKKTENLNFRATDKRSSHQKKTTKLSVAHSVTDWQRTSGYRGLKMTLANVCGCQCATLHSAASINYSCSSHKVYMHPSPHTASLLLSMAAFLDSYDDRKEPRHWSTMGEASHVQLWFRGETKSFVLCLTLFSYLQFIYDMCSCVCPSSLFKTSDFSSAVFCSYSVMLWRTDRCVCSPAGTVCKEHPLAAEGRRDFIQLLRLKLITSSCHLANPLGIPQSWLSGEGFS